MTFESGDVERKTGWGKTNLRVARMTFQRCGRLEQLLTEYCNHYVSICRAVRISANRARPPAAFKKMIGRGYRRGRQPPRRRRSKIIRGTPPIKPFPRETWFQLPSASAWHPRPPSPQTTRATRNDDDHHDERPVTDSLVDARLYSFLRSVGSICFAISIQPRCILDGSR